MDVSREVAAADDRPVEADATQETRRLLKLHSKWKALEVKSSQSCKKLKVQPGFHLFLDAEHGGSLTYLKISIKNLKFGLNSWHLSYKHFSGRL